MTILERSWLAEIRMTILERSWLAEIRMAFVNLLRDSPQTWSRDNAVLSTGMASRSRCQWDRERPVT